MCSCCALRGLFSCHLGAFTCLITCSAFLKLYLVCLASFGSGGATGVASVEATVSVSDRTNRSQLQDGPIPLAKAKCIRSSGSTANIFQWYLIYLSGSTDNIFKKREQQK